MFMIMRIVVVLPAPLGPSRPNMAPRGTRKDRWSTAWNLPKALETSCSSIVWSMGLAYSYVRAEREFIGDGRIVADSGGEGGIRTLETLSGLPVFETGLINHSSTSPGLGREW